MACSDNQFHALGRLAQLLHGLSMSVMYWDGYANPGVALGSPNLKEALAELQKMRSTIDRIEPAYEAALLELEHATGRD